MRNLLFLLLIILALQGCKKGFVVIEKSESFAKEKGTLKQSNIYYLSPTITSYYIRKEVENQFLFTEGYKEYVGNEVVKDGNKIGFNAVLLNDNIIRDKYASSAEELLQLGKCITNITAIQENPLNSSGRRLSTKNYVQQKVFVATPKFSSEFGHLSKEFSPYFGITGTFAVDAKPQNAATRRFMGNHKSLYTGKYFYFYHIVVNIETSEVVYREIKKVPFKFSKTYLSPIIYDSFALLKKNLK